MNYFSYICGINLKTLNYAYSYTKPAEFTIYTPLIAQKPQNAQTQKQKQTVYEDYHINGTVAQRGNLKNNKPDGIWSSYDSDGNLAMRGRYVEGKKEGTWLFWHADRLIQVEYKNNKKLSYFRFDYKDAYVEK